MKITIIAGARPNFMKIAPIIHAIEKYNNSEKDKEIKFRLVHTGQHYDKIMSATFFEQLEIPEPDINLQCGGGSHAQQTAAIIIAFEKELMSNPTDLVIVVGDVNSTMACAIVAKKANTKVAHIEAGIRSFDMEMPEEINRIVTDSLTDFYFTTSLTANDNLMNVGVTQDKIFFVGNVMIDTLLRNQPKFRPPEFWDNLKLKKKKYITLTLHRPSNVDNPELLVSILKTISENANDFKIVFPIHPRTKAILDKQGVKFDNIDFVAPLGYLEFNYLVNHSKLVITDSGGITEETTVMGIPCMTVRENTERPETITEGTNVLVGTDLEKIKSNMISLLNQSVVKGSIPHLWDGKASERIVNILVSLQNK